MEKKLLVVLAVISLLFVVAVSFAAGFVVAYLVFEDDYTPMPDGGPDFPPMVKKPAVYLYPTEETVVNVSLSVDGVLTKTEPEYGGGWSVLAEPSGRIDGRYDYLFYEAQLRDVEIPPEGWSVQYADLGRWFDVNLVRMGLNEREIQQFKDYWMGELPPEGCYEIRLLEESFLLEHMKLSVEPKPNTIIRRNFYFKPRAECAVLTEPSVSTPVRNGFTVVEWGGILED
ncbi:MAG: hypothetical protein NTU61_03165 [Candidatus Altiarchaeota archaeon]|nr:hypothetical protein [Candidatus Altiarchaeota archaeon]